METIFFALMPDMRTTAAVQAFKDRTRELVGPQLYLDDPPHTTVYLAAFPAGFQLVEAVRGLRPPAAVRFNGWHSWVGDPLTGRNTLVCSIHPDDKPTLRQFQQALVAAVAPHRDRPATESRFAGRSDSLSAEQRQNVAAVGFPFLGAGWEPHVTVASILPEHWETVLREFESRPPFGEFTYTRLEAFELHGVEPVSRGRREFSGPLSPGSAGERVGVRG